MRIVYPEKPLILAFSRLKLGGATANSSKVKHLTLRSQHAVQPNYIAYIEYIMSDSIQILAAIFRFSYLKLHLAMHRHLANLMRKLIALEV